MANKFLSNVIISGSIETTNNATFGGDVKILNGTTGASLKLSATSTAFWELKRDSTSGNLTFSDDNIGTVLELSQTTGNATFGGDVGISKQLSSPGVIDYSLTLSSRDDGNGINQVGGEGVGIKFKIAGNDSTTPGNSLVGASIAAIRESSGDTDSSTALGFFVTENNETLNEALKIKSNGDFDFKSGNATFGADVNIDKVLNFNNISTTDGTKIIKFSEATDDEFVIKSNLSGTGSSGNSMSIGSGVSGWSSDILSWRGDGFVKVFGDFETVGNATFGGNVGIGTSSPTAKLHVSGEGILGSNSTNPIAFTGSGSTNAGIGSYNDDTDFNIYSAGVGNVKVRTGAVWNSLGQLTDVGTERMRVNDDGNVGIGTTSPGAKLDVNGTFIATGNATFGGDVALNSDNPNLNLNSKKALDGDLGEMVLSIIDFKKHYGINSGASISMIHPDGNNQLYNAHLSFSTNNNNAGGSLTERMRIKDNGDFDFKSGNANFGGNLIYKNTSLLAPSTGFLKDGFIVSNNGEFTFAINGESNGLYGGFNFLTRKGDSSDPISVLSFSGLGESNFSKAAVFNNVISVIGKTFLGDQINMQEDHFINRRFEMDAIDNDTTNYILLCRYAGGNDVNGSITMDRTSGLRHACKVDILISAGSSALPVGTVSSVGVAGNSLLTSYSLVKCTYNSTEHIALRIINPDGYYESSGAYFNGRIKSTGEELLPVPGASLSAISDFKVNESHQINGDDIWNAGNSNLPTVNWAVKDIIASGNIGVGTTSPEKQLEILYPSYIDKDTVEGVIRLVGQSEVENSGDALSAGIGIEFYNKWQGGSPYSIGRISARSSQTYDGGLQFDVSQNTGAGQTNFITAMTILDTGNVGIGTTNPTSALQVDGQVLISATAPFLDFVDTNSFTDIDDRFRIRAGTNEGSIQWIDSTGEDTTTFMNFKNTGDVIVPNGKVGIGVTSPSYAVDVLGTSAAVLGVRSSGFAGIDVISDRDSGNLGGIRLKHSGDTAQSVEILGLIGGSIDFKLGGSGEIAPSSKVRFDSDGNVGIGTTSPVPALQLVYNGGSYGSDSTSGFINQADTGRATLRLRSITDNPAELYFDTNGAIRWGISCRNGASPNLQFYPQAATPSYAGVAAHTFQLSQNGDVIVTGSGSSGKMGIGTTSPEEKLSVVGNVGLSSLSKLIFASQLTRSPYIQGNWADNYNSGLTFRTYVNGIDTETLKLDSLGDAIFNGKVGIGTTSPSEKLDVDGIGKFKTKLLIGITDDSDYVSLESTAGHVISRVDVQDGVFDYGDSALSISDGKVGIGTSAPSADLDVNGTLKAQAYKSSDGSAGITGTFSFVDHDSSTRTLTIKNGLITAKS